MLILYSIVVKIFVFARSLVGVLYDGIYFLQM